MISTGWAGTSSIRRPGRVHSCVVRLKAGTEHRPDAVGRHSNKLARITQVPQAGGNVGLRWGRVRLRCGWKCGLMCGLRCGLRCGLGRGWRRRGRVGGDSFPRGRRCLRGCRGGEGPCLGGVGSGVHDGGNTMKRGWTDNQWDAAQCSEQMGARAHHIEHQIPPAHHHPTFLPVPPYQAASAQLGCRTHVPHHPPAPRHAPQSTPPTTTRQPPPSSPRPAAAKPV